MPYFTIFSPIKLFLSLCLTCCFQFSCTNLIFDKTVLSASLSLQKSITCVSRIMQPETYPELNLIFKRNFHYFFLVLLSSVFQVFLGWFSPTEHEGNIGENLDSSVCNPQFSILLAFPDPDGWIDATGSVQPSGLVRYLNDHLNPHALFHW